MVCNFNGLKQINHDHSDFFLLINAVISDQWSYQFMIINCSENVDDDGGRFGMVWNESEDD